MTIFRQIMIAANPRILIEHQNKFTHYNSLTSHYMTVYYTELVRLGSVKTEKDADNTRDPQTG